MSDSIHSVILGSGPAGLNCALWLRQLGLTPLIVDSAPAPGGSLANMHRVNRWILGFPDQTSHQLAHDYLDHIRREQIRLHSDCQLKRCQLQPDGSFALWLDSPQQQLSCRNLVIATGIRPIGAEALLECTGHALLSQRPEVHFHPLSHLNAAPLNPGQTAVVLGGGDNACYTTADLVNAGLTVHLVIRGKLNARPAIRRQIETWHSNRRIILHRPAHLSALRLLDRQLAIDLSDQSTVITDWLFPRLGYTPNSAFLHQLGLNLAQNAQGYLTTNHRQQTSHPNIYAIGDITSPWHQSVPNALAQGAIAAQAISEQS
ncbi:MAG: NAD(P)/FAD-dependent oxidoreductase [Methylococcales bacterium]|nr:NAD(P)/FAD-dependent oxidoreductase [Methylococcales bacterium]